MWVYSKTRVMRHPLKVCLGKKASSPPSSRRQKLSIEILLSIYASSVSVIHIVRPLFMNSSLSWSLLCSLLFSRVVTCMPLNDSLFSTNGRNQTVSRPISISTGPNFHCTASAAWTGADELSLSFFQDCWRAINTFFNKDVWPHRVSEYEFLGDGSAPVHHYPQQRTPRRYSYGKLRKHTYL